MRGRSPREMPAAATRTAGTSDVRSGRSAGTTTEMAATTSPFGPRTGAATDDAPSVISSREMQ